VKSVLCPEVRYRLAHPPHLWDHVPGDQSFLCDGWLPVIPSNPLEVMMTIQRVTQKNRGYDFSTMEDHEKIGYIKEMNLAAQVELVEALDEIGWKSWASSRHINRAAFINELVDVLHFAFNMLAAVQCSDRELYNRFREKAIINARRVMNGYTGVEEKCPRCNRALDDPETRCRIELVTKDNETRRMLTICQDEM
jgi:dUTPase-like protein